MLPSSDYIIADRGYDSEALREQIRDKNAIPVIPRKKNSKVGNDDIDGCLYKYRHLVENVFARLKQYRSIATRYDKLKRHYESTLALACCMIWLPMYVQIMNLKDQQTLVYFASVKFPNNSEF